MVPSATSVTEVAARFLFEESRMLDAKDWKGWLSLFVPDCVYWVPGWKDEFDPTDDPDRQVSLMYHASRYELEERVARIQSRKSITAMPLPRTVHAITNVMVDKADEGTISGRASFLVNVYDPRTTRQHANYGHYEYSLTYEAERWYFARKKITLINDHVATVVDFYTL